MERYVEHLEQQGELPLLAAVGQPKNLSEYLIERLRSEADAIAICWHMRRVKFSLRACAASIGMPVSHLSNAINGKKYLRGDQRVALQQHCGNWAIRQWEDKVTGLLTVEETPEQRRIRLLESKLAQLQAA